MVLRQFSSPDSCWPQLRPAHGQCQDIHLDPIIIRLVFCSTSCNQKTYNFRMARFSCNMRWCCIFFSGLIPIIGPSPTRKRTMSKRPCRDAIRNDVDPALVLWSLENSPFLGSGSTGSNGPQRACFTGSTGPTGPTGPTGSTGSRGCGAEWTHHPVWCWRYTLHSIGKINNGTGNIDSHPRLT